MNNRQRSLAVLNYKEYDRLPIVHFGFWPETLEKWAAEGHISKEDAANWRNGTPVCKRISDKLGFDFAWYNIFLRCDLISPLFEPKVINERPDGSKELLNEDGVVVLQKGDATGIPAEVSHTLKDRKSWEEHFKPRMQFTRQRVTDAMVNTGTEFLRFDKGGLDFLKDDNKQNPMGLMLGSYLGRIREWFGVVGLSYVLADDEALFDEIIETISDLCYKQTEYVLAQGAKFDFGHFWEDICYKNGPLINPSVFDRKFGPHYKRITNLARSYGIEIVSVDCDGLIDSLVPTWFENGVNTMFPIEVGTWDASIAPWRQQYGKELRGVGGMKKYAFALDKKAIDDEIERLKPLVELGGYIPCPDHLIAPDAKWDNVRYYCDRMKEVFGAK
jgi:hypothetical protein